MCFNAKDPPVLCQFDFKNAFNNLDRNTLLKQVEDKAPGLLRWVYFTYGSAPPLIVDERHTVWSRQGVQQGDPLGPLLFCLAVQPLVERINTIDGVQWSGWYIDDCNVIAPLATLTEVLRVLESEGLPFGLAVNVSKSKACGPHLSHELMQTHSLQFISFDANKPTAAAVLGLPMGNDDSVR